MDGPCLLLVLTAACNLLVGGFVFARNPRSAVHRAVLLNTCLFATWALLGVMIWSPSLHSDLLVTGRLAHAVCLLCLAGFTHLCLIFPDGVSQAPRGLRLALWVEALLLAAAVMFTPALIEDAWIHRGSLQAHYGPLRWAYFACILLCLGWGLGDLGARYWRSQGFRRLQIQYLFAGLALSGLLNIPSNVLAPLAGFHSGAWMGPVLTLAFVGMVAHAIVRHRLMGMRLFVGRGVAEVLAMGLSATLFLLLLHASRLALGASHQTAAWNQGAAALVIALLFQPLRNRLQSAVSRYFYRPPYDYQSTVRDTSRELAGTLDLERALRYLLRVVVQALQVERGIVLIRDRPSQAFRVRAAHQGWAENDERVSAGIGLAGQSPLVALLESSRELVVVDELEQLLPPDQAQAIADEMRHFGAAIAVPMFSGNLLLALLLVGPKLSGDVFASQDIDLLSTLGAEGGAAIANAQLHQEAMQAERLATLGGLAAGIAHEVKNPLVAVRTFAELLPENYDDTEFREDFSRVVLREVERIDRLIAQLLNYARPAPPLLGAVDLNAVVEETLQLLGYELSRHSIALKHRLQPGLPPVKADAAQLRQVVLNIALNAVQVMPTGGLLQVSTRAVATRGERSPVPYLLPSEAMVEMELANSGPPIPEGHLERVFEPFFSTRNGGTGLGLSICKRIVTEHRGQIRALSTSEGLTAFVVRLPAAEAASIPEPDEIRITEPVPSGALA